MREWSFYQVEKETEYAVLHKLVDWHFAQLQKIFLRKLYIKYIHLDMLPSGKIDLNLFLRHLRSRRVKFPVFEKQCSRKTSCQKHEMCFRDKGIYYFMCEKKLKRRKLCVRLFQISKTSLPIYHNILEGRRPAGQ